MGILDLLGDKQSLVDKHSWDNPSRAVIANRNGHGTVIWYDGPAIAQEIEEVGLHGLDDLGLDDAPDGISIWEGNYFYSPGGFEYPQEGDYDPKGVFRPPTDEEWAAIRKGQSPWQK